ncbi:NAD-dependent epimerase/dehydratase family protein [Cohnella herbarum]|uniref:NAD(P)-dependent oxidoreductase n=1 Tax=Cohnella herbarum TaxID=2728023 RepID=A0A7Z2VH17_9BACL|nr:NAD(P)-dependent oxidoreductase [Cohnella herbarum]QJD82891.1 NAD(P)-dependent oxidoreductase [Cohnella herbarum]
MSKTKIAILGATGHIAKNIIMGLSKNTNYELFLFARNQERLQAFLKAEIADCSGIAVHSFSSFMELNYDAIMNCVGIGDPAKLKKVGGDIFRLTEEFDNLALRYIENSPKTLYINFSSGIAYGSNFNTPADQNKTAVININNISSTDYYTISKMNTEAKHRSFSKFNIVDLRVFGFFSRYIDLKMPYFLSEIVNSLKRDKEFVTGSNDMVRDYIHPRDLVELIERCINIRNINDVFDVYSLEPISKFQMLEFFEKNYGLRVKIEKETEITSVTGLKSNYYSLNRKSDMIGYQPQYSSKDAIISELNYIL